MDTHLWLLFGTLERIRISRFSMLIWDVAPEVRQKDFRVCPLSQTKLMFISDTENWAKSYWVCCDAMWADLVTSRLLGWLGDVVIDLGIWNQRFHFWKGISQEHFLVQKKKTLNSSFSDFSIRKWQEKGHVALSSRQADAGSIWPKSRIKFPLTHSDA